MISNQISQLVNDKPVTFLIASKQEFDWIQQLKAVSEQVYQVDLLEELTETLSTVECHIVIYDDTVFDYPAFDIVTEVTQQSASSVICVISDNVENNYRTDLVLAGAFDIVSSDIEISVFMQRLVSMLNHSTKNYLLQERTRKLHKINLLIQKLHNTEHPTTLIIEAIDLICENFDVYGVAIALDKGNETHLYAGTRDTNNKRRLYESTSPMKEYDPLLSVITSGSSLIFQDIQKYPDYTPIPVIQSPKSAVIVPLKQGVHTIGALAVFSKIKKFTTDDLATFELLALHMTTAYINVRNSAWREEDVKSMRQVLRAWPTLNSLYSPESIAQTLKEFVSEIDVTESVAVCLFSTTDIYDSNIIVASSKSIRKALQSIYDANKFNELTEEFESGLQPLTFHKRIAKTESLLQIYKAMNTSQVTVVPIASNQFYGIFFVANKVNHMVDQSDLGLMENLARVAANVLERNTLIDELQTQTARIESILRSIREGIFFIGEENRVIFCNPQFNELTNISPSNTLYQTSTKLFQELSDCSSTPTKTYEQLEQVPSQIFNNSSDDYPIVEIRNDPDTNLIVEFMPVDTSNEQVGWIGLVRNNNQPSYHAPNNEKTELLQNMLEDIGIPLSDLSKTAMMLYEQFNVLRPQKFENMLKNTETQIQHVQSMWSNMLQIYKREMGGIVIRQNSMNPVDFIEDLLTARRMYLYHRQIRFDTIAIEAAIQIDERLMRQSLINIVEFISDTANRNAPIFVSIRPTNENTLQIFLQEKVTLLPEDYIAMIMEPTSEAILDHSIVKHRLGIYLAKQIIDAHDGSLSISSTRGRGIAVTITLPMEMEGKADVNPATNYEPTYTDMSKGLTMVTVESRSRYMVDFYPQLEGEGHEIIIENNVDDMLVDLSLTKVDIILLEFDPSRTDIIPQCQRLRSQTEIPIVIIAPPELENECLKSLSHGSDDYFLVPLNKDKLFAQLNAIAKRQEIVARTAEPISVGELHLDFSRRRVYLKNKLLDLTRKEYDLLRTLVLNRGQVMTHQQLLSKVWGPEYVNETQYLWVNISRMRRKLEPNKDSPRYIHNEQGVGYFFNFEESLA